MVVDGQQSNQGGPSAAALEEDGSLQVAVIGNLQADASCNPRAVEDN